MGRFDISKLRYLTRDDFRILQGIEVGMKNHEMVPVEIIAAVAGMKIAGCKKIIKELLRHKLVGYDNNKMRDGYRLTYPGYDHLALRVFANRDVISSVGKQIGVGKESDVYIAADDKGVQYALKVHRLGRSSFRAIKSKRDYIKHRKHISWLYLSRIAALKEFAYMKALHDRGFPVPRPVDFNRHCVIMELVQATPLCQVKDIDRPDLVFASLMELIVRLACHGLVHCDFNEFNLLISDDGKVTIIDFPQMVSIDHMNAEWYFDRDVTCVRTFFKKRFAFESLSYPKFSDIKRMASLDGEVVASGFTAVLQRDLDKFREQKEEESGEEGDDDGDAAADDDEQKDGDAVVEPSGDDIDDEKNGTDHDDDDDDDDDDDEDEDEEGEEESAAEPRVCMVCAGECHCADAGEKSLVVSDEEDAPDYGIENVGVQNRSRRAFRDAEPAAAVARAPLDAATIQKRVRDALRAKHRARPAKLKGHRGGGDTHSADL